MYDYVKEACTTNKYSVSLQQQQRRADSVYYSKRRRKFKNACENVTQSNDSNMRI